jgi:DNA repair photolyase
MLDALPARPRKGRGAVTNISGRYEALERVRVDDGWPGLEEERDPWLETTVLPDASRSIIAHNESPDVPFDRSINPYRGCEHGCVYCFARPTHAWLGLSAGLDFETKIFAKHEAAKLLEAAFAKASYQPDVIALGTSTDPYQPIERELRITRQVLEVMARCRHPVAIVTKSNLVLRDLDILAPMAERRLVKVMVSVTTLDRELARRLEPRAPTPALRLEAIRRLSQAGVPTGVLAAPMIPALNDSEMEAILAAAAEAGADTAGYVLLRLPLEIKGLFEEWLETHVPDRKARILKLIRETRGGRLYDPTFGRRMKGQGLYADLLNQRFRLACKRRGLDRRDWAFDLNLFRRPAADPNQLPLL